MSRFARCLIVAALFSLVIVVSAEMSPGQSISLPFMSDSDHHHDDHSCAHCGAGGDDSSGYLEHFTRRGGTWPADQNGRVTVTYSYNNLLDGGLLDPSGNSLDTGLIKSSVEEALGEWASFAPLHFVEVADEGGPVVVGNYPDGQFGQIRISHIFMNGPDPPACSEPNADPSACGARSKAQAFFVSAGGNRAGDIFYDNGDRWQELGTLPQPDVLGATIHELGHTLGLGHTNIQGANMYWVFNRTSGLGTGALHPDDIAGIQSLYGSGTGSVTPLGLNVPEPAAWMLALGALLAICHRGCLVRLPV